VGVGVGVGARFSLLVPGSGFWCVFTPLSPLSSSQKLKARGTQHSARAPRLSLVACRRLWAVDQLVRVFSQRVFWHGSLRGKGVRPVRSRKCGFLSGPKALTLVAYLNSIISIIMCIIIDLILILTL
jgi:hypothetical protein